MIMFASVELGRRALNEGWEERINQCDGIRKRLAEVERELDELKFESVVAQDGALAPAAKRQPVKHKSWLADCLRQPVC